MRNDINDLLQKNEELTNQLYEGQVEISRLQAANEELQEDFQELQEKLARTEAELADREKQLDEEKKLRIQLEDTLPIKLEEELDKERARLAEENERSKISLRVELEETRKLYQRALERLHAMEDKEKELLMDLQRLHDEKMQREFDAQFKTPVKPSSTASRQSIRPSLASGIKPPTNFRLSIAPDTPGSFNPSNIVNKVLEYSPIL